MTREEKRKFIIDKIVDCDQINIDDISFEIEYTKISTETAWGDGLPHSCTSSAMPTGNIRYIISVSKKVNGEDS